MIIPVVLAVVLTVCELAAAWCAHQSIHTTRAGLIYDAAGLVLFAAMYVAYRQTLTHTSLTVLTVLWVVTSQVAAVALDVRSFGTRLHVLQFVGVAVMLAGAVLTVLPTHQVEVHA